MAEIRKRHYILTMQRAGGSLLISTCHGHIEGDQDEESAFMTIWTDRCALMSRKTDMEWDVDNTAVLFYRLVDLT